MFGPTFVTTPEEFIAAHRIARRAAPLLREHQLDVLIALVACHSNGCPLRLLEMVHATDFDLMHDVSGILRHVDRRTGMLVGNFTPRFSRPGASA